MYWEQWVLRGQLGRLTQAGRAKEPGWGDTISSRNPGRLVSPQAVYHGALIGPWQILVCSLEPCLQPACHKLHRGFKISCPLAGGQLFSLA